MEKISLRYASFLFILLALFLTDACHTSHARKPSVSGVYHLVKKNETLESIAGAYRISPQRLLRVNNMTDAKAVTEGTALFIPSANRVINHIPAEEKSVKNETVSKIKVNRSTLPGDIPQDEEIEKNPSSSPKPDALQKDEMVQATSGSKAPSLKETVPASEAKKITNGKNIAKKSVIREREEKIPVDKKRFIWPVKGKVGAQFGIQPDKTYNNWVKIMSGSGTKVKAAAAGTVIFSSNLKNYGETIIIRHKDNFATVYTHLKKRYVKIDQGVRKGEAIASMGEKDGSGAVFMNFEIRLKGKARNPLLFLP